jgi:arylsulfatase A-like enzyme
VVTSVDLYPTLVDLLGLEVPAEVRFDGVSLAAVLRDPSERLAREAVFNFMPHDFDFGRAGVTVRQGDWKLIRWFDARPGDSPHELYDLRQDVGETANLASQQPQVVERLDALIDGFLRETGARLPKPNPAYEP